MEFSNPYNPDDRENDPFSEGASDNPFEDDRTIVSEPDSDPDLELDDPGIPPPPPRRRSGGGSGRGGRPGGRGPRGGGSGGDRQQLMVRRAIALGAGLLVLILLVIGAKGCLDARKNRSLDDYANSVTQIVNETNALGKSFFGRLSDPGELSVTEFTSEIQSDRSAMDGFLSRVEKLDTPGDMSAAQDSLTLVYQLRASAMDDIADQMSTALGDEGAERARRQIAAQMEVLSAADVLYNRVTRHQIDNTIANNGASAPAMPVSTFIEDPQDWITVDAINGALDDVSGSTSTTAPDDGLTHGTGIDPASSVTVDGTTLSPDTTTTIAASTDPTVEVTVMNQGGATETDVTVGVSVDGGTSLEAKIPEIAAGSTGTATIPLTPAPTGEVTLDVSVDAVPGEQFTTNNEASYTVSFG
ncbi:MAG TPA: CARDB domain-containing protein [Solirubrobacterales bacterium]|nr:CARDB domain-containing protein [Solirubrobacterales bacterium]HMY26144.1 CARDB domain-containing protein [Solirubrobacterales bacterium]HNC92745.1 CARDB domain-containing protein [Solirubrobacterales bacterium]HNE77603.1 CARDB domain-containing protein [Solirubrobacterales bacterium]HNK65885.1 CARDB domain-containing protein [Solirubrobacterales bacterium]